jgi:diguanylate cyclase (GGDEF)-like protein
MRTFERLAAGENGATATHAVMLIDCDYFKSVNDTLGHAAGDAVLLAIAERLKDRSGQTLIAARLGGDEFAVISGGLHCSGDAAEAAAGLEQALMRPVVFEAHVIPVSVSIGVAVFAVPAARSIDQLLAEADLALYRAKRDGRGCARVYDAAIDDPSKAAAELPATTRAA